VNQLLCGGLATASAFVLLSCSGGESPTAPAAAPAADLVPLLAQHQLDGRRLAFHACCSGDSEEPLFDVFVYDVDQASLLPLPGLNLATANDRDPSLTDDGGLIAFGSDRSGAGDVFLYDVGAQSLVPLPGLNRPGAFDGNPSISGTGRFIAFESNRAGAGNVFLYDRTTSSLVSLPGLNSRAAFDGQPSLSDDARFLTFSSNRGGNGNVFLFDRNRQKLVSVPGLNSRAALDDQPALSGDGDLIAFRSLRRGSENGSDLFLYHRHSRVLDRFPIDRRHFPAEPALSRDGALLLLSAFDPEADVDDRDIWAFDRRAPALDMLPDLNDEVNLEGDGGPALHRAPRTG
jgi:Tol biopolymer transport system component